MNPLESIRNPFLQEVVSDPWVPAQVDVEDINSKAFHLCVRLTAEVPVSGSTSLLIYGEPGSGKTHLMARLRRHLEGTPDDAVFVSVRLNTTPGRMWRYLRRTLVTDLLRPWKGSEPRLRTLVRTKLSGESEAVLTEGLGFSLATVLGHYREGRHPQFCAPWLRGESLPEPALERLEIGTDETEEESVEEQSQNLVQQICHLAAPSPVVFCFDQVESLQAAPGDLRGLSAFGRMGSELHDNLRNVLLVSTIQTQFLLPFENAVGRATLDRMARHRADLQPLTWQQGRRLVLRRLDALPELSRLRAGCPPESLWPLSEPPLQELFGAADACVARRLIHRAAELFEQQRGQAKTAQSIEEFLSDAFSARLEQAAGASASDPEDVLAGGLPLLLGITGHNGWHRDGSPKGIDLIVESPKGPIAVAFCGQANAGSFARRLKHVVTAANSNPYGRLILIRNSGLQIGPNARKSRERLRDLTGRGARLVSPTPEAMAALEALRRLWADAQSGDLNYRGEVIPLRTVQEWLANHLPDSLADLASQWDTEPESDLAGALSQLLLEQPILAVGEAARKLGRPTEEIAAYASRHPNQTGFLAGPPAVVFRPVSGNGGADDDTD